MAAKRFSSDSLTETEYYVMLSLKTPLHGYGIILSVKEATNGNISLSAATLYTVLSRLLERNFIEEAALEKGADPRRKPYKLTKNGTAAIIADVWRRCEMADYGASVLGEMGYM